VVKVEKSYADPHPFADVVAALDNFKDSPLVNRPGEKYAYSTHGFILLSAVVERAGRQRYADQVAERIAGPLGMTSFRPDYEWEDVPNRAVGYRGKAEAHERRPDDQVQDVSWKLGGGGFTSTAVDLARFGVGLIDRRLVSEESERVMWTVVKPADPTGAKPYGSGFFVIERPGGTKWVGHDGSQQKARTALILDPAGRRGIAVMSNSEWADVMTLAMSLLGELD
jgi:CubicO group peptidase (beta-lactamase class C family)